MSKSIFINLLQADEKEAGLIAAISALSSGEESPAVHAVEPAAFGAIPGAPFAYWAPEWLRSLFTTMPALDAAGTAKVGLQTGDDFRFVRIWWEINPATIVTGDVSTRQEEFRACTFEGKKWAPFAKGGAYSVFYADIHLVVNWERDGEEIRNFMNPATRRPQSRAQNTDAYFLPGLTWSDRTTKMFSARVWPAGGVFSVKGSAGFFGGNELLILGFMNTQYFNGFLGLMVGAGDAAARSYQVGTIGRVPMPSTMRSEVISEIKRLSTTGFNLGRFLDTVNETSHVFSLPELLQVDGETVQLRIENWNCKVGETIEHLSRVCQTIEEHVSAAYGLSPDDQALLSGIIQHDSLQEVDHDDEEATTLSDLPNASTLIKNLLSWCTGVVFGRFNVELATIAKSSSQPLPDPFAPLPIKSPGMLSSGSHKEHFPSICADDEGHPFDLTNHVIRVLDLVRQDNAHPMTAELMAGIGVKNLRDYFTNHSGFFADHIRRYSKSRRKAPIYWQLRSPKKHYGLWLYYPRMTKDTLYVAQRDYVGPKLAHEEDVLQGLRAQLTEAKLNGGNDERALAHQIEAQEELVQDVAALRDELKAVADAGYDPDLDDGVIINIAPLHRLVPWKEAAACYKELKAGKYPWSSMHQRYTFR